MAFAGRAGTLGYSVLQVPASVYTGSLGGAQAGFLYGSYAFSRLHGTSILVGPGGLVTSNIEVPFYFARTVPLTFRSIP